MQLFSISSLNIWNNGGNHQKSALKWKVAWPKSHNFRLFLLFFRLCWHFFPFFPSILLRGFLEMQCFWKSFAESALIKYRRDYQTHICAQGISNIKINFCILKYVSKAKRLAQWTPTIPPGPLCCSLAVVKHFDLLAFKRWKICFWLKSWWYVGPCFV